jgi:hypothetical protein
MIRDYPNNIAAKAESSSHKYWHAHYAFNGDSGEKELYDLNDSLADIMHNMAQSSANKRMLENENDEQKEAELFAETCRRCEKVI